LKAIDQIRVQICQEIHLCPKDINLPAMNEKELERYGRHILLPQIDYEGQKKLMNAHVMIIGLGGLGSPASIYLASSGIGKLTLCDFDQVELSNLQRQIVHRDHSLSTNKAHSAKKTLSEINAEIDFQVIDQKLTEDQLSQYLQQQKVDVVLDCSDNFKTRYAINRACNQNKVPLVSGSAIKFEGQLMVFDFKDQDSPCYECVFPDNNTENELRCADHGILAPVVGIIGTMQSLEAIKLILNLSPLNSKLLIFDGMANEWKTIHFKQDKECKICANAKNSSS